VLNPPPLQLVAMGPPAARLGEGPAPPEVMWRKHFALLIYLALSPGLSRSRAHLMAMLWPERTDARARHSLNEALHRLRSFLGPGRLLTEGETVSLSSHALGVDVLEDDGEQAGEFLEGFSLGDSQPFDEWLEHERQRLRERVVAARVRRARQLLAEGLTTRAVEVARSARERDRLSEPAVRVLMEALALEGDHAAALAELGDLRARLAELGGEPTPGLTELAGRIRSGPVTMPAEPARPGPGLVGRAAALAALMECLPRPGSAAARLLVILGEPGQGKTRLLQELGNRAALAGITVAAARALPSDQGRAWSALRGIFRGGLLGVPGLVGVDPARLRRLAAAVPELAERFPPQAAVDDGELAYSLREALEAMAEETALLLVLDDAHLADGPSLAVLQVALEGLSGGRVTLALSAAPEDPDAAPELLRLQAALGRGLPGTSVRLDPLPEPELALLVSELAPWVEPGSARDRLVRRLAHDTSGNPFLAVTLLRGLGEAAELRERAVQWPEASETLDAPLPRGVPQLIQSAVLAQVARLERAGGELLAIAATLGTRVEAGMLAALTGLSEQELAERLAVAERLQLIVATDDGYGFPGAVVASVLEHVGMTRGRRRELRRRAVEYLGSRTDPASRLWRLELLARLGEQALAAEAIQLGETLLDQGDRHAARRAMRLAGATAETVPAGLRAAWVALRNRLDAPVTG
jgi:DNA-binding SARP family transcriptional activator